MATKKAPAKKAPAKKTPRAKRKPEVTPEAREMINANAIPKGKAIRRDSTLFTVVVSIKENEFDPKVLKFIRAVQASGGFKDSKEVVTAMMRMAMDNARTMGPRYFGPQLKRYLK
jgi:hypothetical protein